MQQSEDDPDCRKSRHEEASHWKLLCAAWRLKHRLQTVSTTGGESG